MRADRPSQAGRPPGAPGDVPSLLVVGRTGGDSACFGDRPRADSAHPLVRLVVDLPAKDDRTDPPKTTYHLPQASHSPTGPPATLLAPPHRRTSDEFAARAREGRSSEEGEGSMPPGPSADRGDGGLAPRPRTTFLRRLTRPRVLQQLFSLRRTAVPVTPSSSSSFETAIASIRTRSRRHRTLPLLRRIAGGPVGE
jgi:hypothetical protein